MKLSLDHRVWRGTFIGLVMILAGRLIWGSPEIIPMGFVLLAGHFLFFRDPVRRAAGPEGPVSPADGKVVEISSCHEERFLKAKAVKIGIFLSIFDPHVNRAPEGGTISYLKYEPGKFLNALKQQSVNLNESNWIGIEAARKILLRQIAGAIARRIYWDVRLQERVDRGAKLGIICYGSRVECYFPHDQFQPSVRLGDRVKAGQTILGAWKS